MFFAPEASRPPNRPGGLGGGASPVLSPAPYTALPNSRCPPAGLRGGAPPARSAVPKQRNELVHTAAGKHANSLTRAVPKHAQSLTRPVPKHVKKHGTSKELLSGVELQILAIILVNFLHIRVRLGEWNRLGEGVDVGGTGALQPPVYGKFGGVVGG